MAGGIQVIRSRAGAAARDTAVCRALLEAVAAGERCESLRLWRPGDALAFSLTDRANPGFGEAVAAARDAGFEPFLRLAGGHAAVYARESLAFAWTRPVADPRAGIEERFRDLSELVAAALCRLGLDARVGAVEGEYCPGDHSVNARGRVKLMGVGQRVVRGAAHVGGVIVVRESARARAVLEPVYRALSLDFDPATVGAVADERADASCEAVGAALLEELSARVPVREAELDATLLARAERIETRHRIESI